MHHQTTNNIFVQCVLNYIERNAAQSRTEKSIKEKYVKGGTLGCFCPHKVATYDIKALG